MDNRLLDWLLGRKSVKPKHPLQVKYEKNQALRAELKKNPRPVRDDFIFDNEPPRR